MRPLPSDPLERGRQFEWLIVQVLRTDRAFQRRFTDVWHWNEWPGRDVGDFYADIVARRTDGGLASIQVKCFNPEHVISAPDIDSFLAMTQEQVDTREVSQEVRRKPRALPLNRWAPANDQLLIEALDPAATHSICETTP